MPSDRLAARFGLSVQVSIAAVPAFAPVGREATDYERHRTGPDPLPEVLAWHREHHPDVAGLDDFLPELTLDRFDAGAIVDLAVAAGAGFLAPVSRVDDGLRWWDSAVSDRTSTRLRPGRDLLAELHAASAGRDLAFGLIHPRDDTAEVDELVERFAPDPLLPEPGVALFDAVPDPVPAGPWVLRRSLSHSLGHNRAERAGDHLDAAGIVDLLTEVVAKGGRLVLNLGLRADGSVPEEQSGPLREAGHWVRAHADLVGPGEPFDVWGDGEVRYSRSLDGEIRIVDLRALPRRTIAHFSPHRYPIESVAGAVGWSQDTAGVHLEAAPGVDPANVYRLRLRPRTRTTLAVRGEAGQGTVTLGTQRYATIAEALSAARPGQVVRLGPGRRAEGEVVVPAGVTLSGAGEATTVVGTVRLDGTEATAERLTVDGSVRASGDRVRIERCTVDGTIAVTGGDRPEIAWNVAPSVSVVDAERAAVQGNRIERSRADVGILVRGGTGHRIEANTVLAGPRCGIRLDRCTDASVSAGQVTGRWWSIHLAGCVDCRVAGNRVTGMRAYTVTSGQANEVTANVADGTDTGVLLEGGAEGTVIAGNRFTGCRVAVLAWDHTGSTIGGNVIRASRDHDLVDGPPRGAAAGV